MSGVAAFFHCYAAGRWREPTHEFLDALVESAFPGPLFLGLVGSSDQRELAVAEIRERFPAQLVAEATAGVEDVTLRSLHEYAIANPGGVVIYCHSKGASHQERRGVAGTPVAPVARPSGPSLSEFRRHVEYGLVREREHWLRALLSGEYDLVVANRTWNFWAASCKWAASRPPLPPLQRRNRGLARDWITTPAPRLPVVTPTVLWLPMHPSLPNERPVQVLQEAKRQLFIKRGLERAQGRR